MTARRLLAALMMALVASGLFTFWVSKRFAKPAATNAPQQHYVASLNDLEAGQTLEKPELTLVDWPASKPLAGGFAKAEDLAGRTVLFPLSAGEPILARDLSAPGTGSGLTARIPEGMRAISLKSDEVVGVAGFLLPGTHVDVLVTYHGMGGFGGGSAGGGAVTSTVLQDTQILAAGQKTQPDPEGKPSTVDVVTLLVSPADAERVVLASSQGVVHFVLRNGADHARMADHAAQMPDFGGAGQPMRQAASAMAAKPVAVAATIGKNKGYVVQTLSGDKQKLETFQ